MGISEAFVGEDSEEEIAMVEKDFNEEIKIVKSETNIRLCKLFSEKILTKSITLGKYAITKGQKISEDILENLTTKDYVEKIKNININELQTISKLDLEIVDGKGCQRVASVIKLL